MSRRSYINVEVREDIDVPLDEVFEQIKTEEIVDELKRRQAAVPQGGVVPPSIADDLEEVYSRLMRGRAHDALILLDRLLHPHPIDADAYKRALATRDPETGRPVVQ
jgi:hypothetical protein